MSLPGPAAALCAAGLFSLATAALVTAAAVPSGDSDAGPPVATRPAAHTPPHIEGPPPGHTGGFGEPTCAACHFGAPLNAPGATLEVFGIDDGYRPGQRHPVTIRFQSFDMLAAGFQGSFRFEDGDRRGAGAGEIRPLDDRVTVVPGEDGDPEYVQHTRAGSAPVDGVAEWTFEWRAPDADAPVVLHLAANSGGGDDSPLDDLVYTASLLLAPTADPARTQASR
ncbi:choice-of-anchor V domain-containing protein [Candidatus Palauibacter sp.]|uniref:choice-of-anchor V domain-containing protein n=1 Tax=Candidatus Palauibacter sp. TaxID=3101350 RepID=UPI003B019E4F